MSSIETQLLFVTGKIDSYFDNRDQQFSEMAEAVRELAGLGILIPEEGQIAAHLRAIATAEELQVVSELSGSIWSGRELFIRTSDGAVIDLDVPYREIHVTTAERAARRILCSLPRNLDGKPDSSLEIQGHFEWC